MKWNLVMIASKAFMPRNMRLYSLSIPKEPWTFNKGFVLPPRPPGKTDLELVNSHPNDLSITFESDSHTYFYDGVKMDLSVTTLIEKYFEKFDPDVVIPKMMSGNNWPRAGYFVSFNALIISVVYV